VELSAKRGLNNEIFPTAGLLTSNYNWQWHCRLHMRAGKRRLWMETWLSASA